MADTAVHLTLFSAQKRLTKRIFLEPNGSVGKESAALARATAQRVDVSGAHGLARLLDGLGSQQAMAYGVTERLSANIGPRDHLRPGEVSRSRDNFGWAAGAGVLFLDLDGQHGERDVPTLQAALNDALPGIASAPQVWTRSSSAAIHNPETGETADGGLHCYVLIADASAVPAVGQRLYDGLWLNGYGRHDLSNGENPAALERCLIDASVWQPERLDYAAAPIVEAPLSRTAPTVISVQNADAEPLNPQAVKPLTDAQQTELATIRRDSKAKATGRVQRQRQALLDTLPPAQRQQQRQRWLSLDRQTLTPDAPIILSDGRTITAGDVLNAPEAYNGQRCYDPQDPTDVNASATQGRIYADDQGVRVFSFAHGGRTFRVLPEAPEEAQQAAPDVLALAPEPSPGEIVSACYRHRASATAEGLDEAAAETGATYEYASRVWLEHLQSSAKPLHCDAQPTQTFGTFEEVADAFGAYRESLFTLAKLGTGKTRHLGGRVVAQAQAEGRPVLTVTVLRALTWANADVFSATHYSDVAPALDASHTVSTTLHSLCNPKMTGFLARLEQQRGVLVIDEAAAVAGLLFSRESDNGILTSQQRHDILTTLQRLAHAGVQTLMLDGDGVPCANVLASVMGCRVVRCTEQHHPDPVAAVYPETVIGSKEEGDTRLATPCHAEIVKLLKAGERVVLPTDSREQADRLHTLYAPMAAGGALCIHGHNADGEEQSAFRANPNEQAQRWQLVTYSPALSVGVSVTSVTPHVFVFARAGSLDAAGLWQLARRYRSAADDLVRFVVGVNLCRPQRQRIGLHDIQSDIAHHAHALDALNNAPELRGMVAAEWQRNLFEANPLHALIGHLANIEVTALLAYSGDDTGVEDRKLAREAVQEARIERAAVAPKMDELEAVHFERKARATPDDQAKLERHKIEQGLALVKDDFEDDGTLPRELVKDVFYDNLGQRVRRLSWLMAAAGGADLERSDLPAPGYVYMKHKNAQARVMLDILRTLASDSGEITVTASKAREVANVFRQRIHVAYSDLPKPPTKKARDASHTRWLRSLLTSWGLLSGKSEQDRTRGEDRGERQYRYEIEEYVETYSGRLAAKYLPESTCPSKALEAAWLSGSRGNTTCSGVLYTDPMLCAHPEAPERTA